MQDIANFIDLVQFSSMIYHYFIYKHIQTHGDFPQDMLVYSMVDWTNLDYPIPMEKHHPVFAALILNGDSCWYLRWMCLKMGYTSKISISTWQNDHTHHWISRSPIFRQTNCVYH